MRIIFIVYAALFLSSIAFAAPDSTLVDNSVLQKGTVYGTLFLNANTSLMPGQKVRAFEVKRAYLGYKAEISRHYSANIKLDIGNPDDVQDYAAKKRFAYFKNAYLQYKNNNILFTIGIADCYQFKEQEKFWGKRYIQSSFQDKYKFGPSADIGAFFNYKFNNFISADVSLVNGEGYNSVQNDESFKATAGITVNPYNWLTLRLYSDRFTQADEKQFTLATFAGLKFKPFELAAEFNYQANNKNNPGFNWYGLSTYTKINITKKINVFGRYDILRSVITRTETLPWNIAGDGSAVFAGAEYVPLKNIKVSLNYQDWVAYAANGNDSRFLFVNLDISF